MDIILYIGIIILMCSASAAGAVCWTKNSIKASIKGNEDNLSELSLLFLSLDGPMKRLAYEFRAMAELYKEKGRIVSGKASGKSNRQNSITESRRLGRRQPQAAVAKYSGTSERCGDSCLHANLPDGRFALALSDGMGKGEGAACKSNLAVTSIIKMLQAGLDTELALRLLNTILMSDTEQEQFPTMDLGIYDPGSREIHFYKIGAAPTIIRHKSTTGKPITSPTNHASNPQAPARHKSTASQQSTNYRQISPTHHSMHYPTHHPALPPTPTGTIEILSAPTMPMGIAEPCGLRCVSAIVRPGDQIIMISDGIADSVRGDTELKWLQRLLAGIRSHEPQTVCDLILKEASANYGFREKDDMLAAVFNIT